MRTSSYVLVVLLLGTAFVAAQGQNESTAGNQAPPPPKARGGGPGGPMGMSGLPGLGHDWWRNSEIAQAINLSDAQKQQLNQIFTSHRPTLITLKGNVELEEGKLHDLLDEDQPQQKDVLPQMTRLQSARNELEKEFTIMSLAFRGVLSPDQWKQLQQITHARMKNFFMHHREPGQEFPPPPQ